MREYRDIPVVNRGIPPDLEISQNCFDHYCILRLGTAMTPTRKDSSPERRTWGTAEEVSCCLGSLRERSYRPVALFG